MNAKDLTLEELADVIMGKNCWEFNNLNNKLPKVIVSDGPVGLRHPDSNDGWTGKIIPSVAYPCAQALSMTWNMNLVNDMAKCLADDCIDLNVDILLNFLLM